MFSKFFSSIKSAFSNKDVKERADILENLLYGQASSSDLEGIHAIAQLTTSLCNNNCGGVVDAGVFVFCKIKDTSGDFQIMYKRLTVQERIKLNERPTLLQDPYKLLENLESAVMLDRQEAIKLKQIAEDLNKK